MDELKGRYIRGGDGSHWDGCDDTHWDCKIAKQAERIAKLERQLEIACHVHTGDKEEFDWAILDRIFNAEQRIQALEAMVKKLTYALADALLYENLMPAKMYVDADMLIDEANAILDGEGG